MRATARTHDRAGRPGFILDVIRSTLVIVVRPLLLPLVESLSVSCATSPIFAGMHASADSPLIGRHALSINSFRGDSRVGIPREIALTTPSTGGGCCRCGFRLLRSAGIHSLKPCSVRTPEDSCIACNC